MKPDIDYTLYLVTDRNLMYASTIEDSIKLAVAGGCTLVQLREKEITAKEFYETAVRVRQLTSRLNIPLIINDRVDIAIAVNADGVHVGQDDLPPEQVRNVIGPDKIIGVSASNLKEAIAARDAGADYLGIGAMYATETKSEANQTALSELECICEVVDLPIVAIGGINLDTVSSLSSTGIDGIAVVSAIVAQPNAAEAARDLKSLFLERKA